jgi:hypothetical protein
MQYVPLTNAKHIHKRQTNLLVREDATKGGKGSVINKVYGREFRGSLLQNELIGDKPPVVT